MAVARSTLPSSCRIAQSSIEFALIDLRKETPVGTQTIDGRDPSRGH